MNCEADDPHCVCDASGCYLVDGAQCVQASACKSQHCGVTQDNDSVCCAEACDASDVCAADGSACEAAATCEDTDTRCSADGDYQRCEDGQWTTTEPCDGRGCSIELGGCLSARGDACAETEECGEGTCQETPDGSTICCDLSCGSCKACSAEGTSCEYPDTVPPECDCSSDSDCDDGLDCTSDACTDGVCANDVASGTCLIDDECYDQTNRSRITPAATATLPIRAAAGPTRRTRSVATTACTATVTTPATASVPASTSFRPTTAATKTALVRSPNAMKIGTRATNLPVRSVSARPRRAARPAAAATSSRAR